MNLTQDVLDKIYSIMQTHPEPIVLDSFAEYGLTDKDLIRAALSELQKQGKIMEWPLFAPLPERQQT